MFKDIKRPILHLICVLPSLWLFHQVWLWYNFAPHDLTANPIEYITDFTGDWTVRFLLLTLSISPLAKIFKLRILKYRRAVGLYAFYYGLLHFLNYMVLDYFFDWTLILEDIFKRPAITFGMLAFVLLVPLAVTSASYFMKKMGKAWQKLHNIIYVITIFAVTHNYMMVKADVLVPTIHAIILAGLLGYRLYSYKIKQTKRANRNKHEAVHT
ncbi:sulfite oxidase heme-binding subunit YedZ [Pseudemcibacter aquimaris]|uniref:sulfite oxidase heme-binding subunit YedZ n=1 Tax=Pseudemcibacter aquimaris TaxID=2857064 RepID=UPI002011AA9A|nr:protein-methionine-sulfoxide reductase heme-binding subunit MsrQ [Pseudemcibacter aquimaris]MCC3862015.1 sulfoxide reductase heme-binding subunit YedZ [Pseudemcibacter aquimaris]WDU58767.1 sulfoxide reductase heme-binding subunit YedZ [Pseudemcibacter aquimaris]